MGVALPKGPFGRAPAPAEKGRVGARTSGTDFVAPPASSSYSQSWFYNSHMLQCGAAAPPKHLVELTATGVGVGAGALQIRP